MSLCALEKLRQEDHELEANADYIARSYLKQTTKQPQALQKHADSVAKELPTYFSQF